MSTEWRLTDAQLAQALLGVPRAPGVPLPTLVQEAKVEVPAGADAAIRLLAAPQRALALTVNSVRHLGFHPALVASRDGQAASLLHLDDGWHLRLHAAPTEAVLALGHALAVEAMKAAPGARLSLDLTGFCGVLAAADVEQEAELRSRLDRRHLPPPALSPRALEKSLAHGLASGDARWAVCATRWTAPVSLGAARGRMKEGMKALGNGGLEVARTMTRLRGGAGVTAIAWTGGERVVQGHAQTLATEDGLWWVGWDGIPVAPHVTLAGVSGAEAQAKLVAWL